MCISGRAIADARQFRNDGDKVADDERGRDETE